jgi:hypothetical protein
MISYSHFASQKMLTAMPSAPLAPLIVFLSGITASASPTFTSLVANTPLGGNPASSAAGCTLLLQVLLSALSALQ